MSRLRRTKIVATIGPASDSLEVLRALIRAGTDVVRLNLSHGDVAEHLDRLSRVRAAAEECGRPVAVLADLPGPKIRSAPFPDGGAYLEIGSRLELVPGEAASSVDRIEVDYPTLLEDVKAGAIIQLGDGAISMRIDEVGDDAAVATVLTGARATGSPGVHIPSDAMRLTCPTTEDLHLAEQMATAGVEFVAASFVRRGSDVDQVRAVVGPRAQVIAKIETSTALENLDEIIRSSDAVMVARGDLGIDCPLEDVPHLQKQIIRRSVEMGVPVITATQMLESMVAAPTPTRAEVSDVANAVFDGTDAVMLSGETAIGRDPVAVVETMASVALRAEREASYRQWGQLLGRLQRENHGGGVGTGERITMALSHAALMAADDSGATAILCCTRSGRTARAMARFRPEARMVGLSPDPKMVRTMSLTWGIEPLQVETYQSTDEMVWFAVERALESGLIDHGDTVLVLAGAPGRAHGPGPAATATDVLRLVEVD